MKKRGKEFVRVNRCAPALFSKSIGSRISRILSAFTILVSIFSVSAYSGELVLVKGKGVCVCEAHFENLKSMVGRDRMVCERDEYYPEKNDFSGNLKYL